MEEVKDFELYRGIAPEHRAAYGKVHRALHHLWSKYVSEPNYDKQEWRELDDAFSAFALAAANTTKEF